ncbi:hypothetical protein BB558_005157 [Smittium angustum]|uniref:Uncharacterized protein n=1 Tax=Smittium angustum TaxID=133377 RepID=A0A2U1J1D4_SMIAN|nr:hypothetical protein BB558_005157 [Smittium angustum]
MNILIYSQNLLILGHSTKRCVRSSRSHLQNGQPAISESMNAIIEAGVFTAPFKYNHRE